MPVQLLHVLADSWRSLVETSDGEEKKPMASPTAGGIILSNQATINEKQQPNGERVSASLPGSSLYDMYKFSPTVANKGTRIQRVISHT